MEWFPFALLTALLWGIGQNIIKKGLESVPPVWNVLIGSFINFATYIPVALLNRPSFSLSFPQVIILLVIPFLYIFYYYAIEKKQVSFSGTIFATYPVTTISLSVLFLHEQLNFQKVIMIALILVGCFLLSRSQKSRTNLKNEMKFTWLAWAIFASIATGLGDFLAKLVLSDISVHTYNFYYPFFYFANFFLFFLIDKKGRKLSKSFSKTRLVITFLGILTLNLGVLLFNFALSRGPASLVTTVSSAFAGVSIVIAYFIFKEKISGIQWVSLLMIVIGIIFIGF
ncbi:MAG: DMT family transporter [Candidatus Levybacteria bacterium]|nr:DMT family transporter [Candidatus Levybacteria bacterium]